MRVFKNKFLVKLIALICLFLTWFNFIGNSKVYADDDEVWGGILIKPITALMIGIGDGIMDIMHDAILDQKVTMIRVYGDNAVWRGFKVFVAVLLVIVTAVAAVIAAMATAGLATAIAGAVAGGAFSFSMASVTAGMLWGGVAVGTIVGIRIGQEWFPNNFYLPIYEISAEEIFSNQLQLFDVNFFEPMPDKEKEGLVPKRERS